MSSEQLSRTKQLLRKIMQTQEDEADCDECFAKLDVFAEMLEAGSDPAKILPRIEQHLKQCDSCHEEFIALMATLKAESDMSGTK